MNTAMLYFNLIRQRRSDPRDGMISSLIAAEVDREDGASQLDDIEIAGFCALLGGAGAETVTKLIGNAAVSFSRHPEQWHQLQVDPSKIAAAVEEVLRYDPPVQYDVRRTPATSRYGARRSPRTRRVATDRVG